MHVHAPINLQRLCTPAYVHCLLHISLRVWPGHGRGNSANHASRCRSVRGGLPLLAPRAASRGAEGRMPPRQHSVQALKLRARAQTALPEQSMLLRHRAARKETEERCSVALLTAEIKVSCAPCCPAPPEACVGALGLVCMQASLTVPAPHRSQPRTTAHWTRCTPRKRSCEAGGPSGRLPDGAEPLKIQPMVRNHGSSS